MLRAFVILGALLMLVPVAYAHPAVPSQSAITTWGTPGVNVTLPNGDSFNVTYSDILLIATVHTLLGAEKTIVFGADLQQQNWGVKQVGKAGNMTTYYNASMTLTPTDRLPLGYSNQSFLNVSTFPTSVSKLLFPRITMSVVITQSSHTDSIVIGNQSAGLGNASENVTFKNLSVSTLTIDNYITVNYFPPPSVSFQFGTAIGNSFVQDYRIELLQSVDAVVNGHPAFFERFNGSANARENQIIPVAGWAIGRSTSLGYSQGLFWWPSNYTTNSTTMGVQSYFLRTYSGLDLGFQYYGHSTTSIVQDPYFSIINATLNTIKIINEKLHQAYVEIVQNAELFGTGLIVGTILIGMSYSVYRRRRL